MAKDLYTAKAIVVGAGPVGLLTALKLGQAGIDTIVLEAHDNILKAPRAIAYLPVVINELKKMGLISVLEPIAYVNDTGVSYITPQGKILAKIPMAPGSREKDQFVLMLGQYDLACVIREALDKCPSVTVKFGHRVGGIEQGDNGVTIMATHNHEDLFFKAEWVVGADGANSSVRRISNIPFEGFTWDNFRLVAVDIWYDFAKEGNYWPAAWAVHPEDWAVVCRTGKDGPWRLTYGEPMHLSGKQEDVLERSKSRIPTFLPGSKEYKLDRLNPYYAHQRCAKTYRKGRVLLAGDAAHANNPIGGLGLTGGILDAITLGNAMIRVINKGEDDSLITRALDSRRDIWLNRTNPMSTTNFQMLFATQDTVPEKAKQREGFFALANSDLNFCYGLHDVAYLLPDSFEG